MQANSEASLMRVYLQESERHGHQALYEVLVTEARDAGLSGATVLRGIRGFGPSARILSSRILDLTSDLPIIVELIDRPDRIAAFGERVNALLDESESGALVTVEDVKVLRVQPGSSGGA